MNLFTSLYNTAKGLSDVIDKAVPQYSNLSDAIQDHFSEQKEYERGGVWPMHVTDVINLCARKQYLLAQKREREQKIEKRATLSDRVVWRIGKSTEELMRDATIASMCKKNAYGSWTCVCGQISIFGLGRNPQHIKCIHCKTDILSKYNEAKLYYDDIVSGNPDLLVKFGPDGKLTVVEYKSMTGDDFKKLVHPKADHIQQGYYYLKILEKNIEQFAEMGISVNLDFFLVHYTNKHYQFRGTYQDSVQKDFKIVVDQIPQVVKELFDTNIKEVKRLKYSGQLPHRTKCNSATCPEAKTCPVVVECFSEE